jgi:hypothetical protein
VAPRGDHDHTDRLLRWQRSGRIGRQSKPARREPHWEPNALGAVTSDITISAVLTSGNVLDVVEGGSTYVFNLDPTQNAEIAALIKEEGEDIRKGDARRFCAINRPP